MPDNFSSQIKPLTRAYTRREEVIQELHIALSLDEAELRKRVKAREFKAETLVYLFREASGEELAGEIFELLTVEVGRIVGGRVRRVGFDVEDFVQEIAVKLITDLSDRVGGAGDYAEVSFGQYVKSLGANHYRTLQRQREREFATDAIDDDSADRPPNEPEDARSSAALEKLIYREALDLLPEHIRTACILSYSYGWKTASKDPGEPTLAKYFNVSDRQIRNWLSTAAKLLSDYRGKQK